MNPKLSLAIGILCISFSPIFVKLAGVPPVPATFYRIIIGWLCLVPYVVAKGKLKIGPKALWIAIAGGVVFGVDLAIWNISLMTISATISTLLGNLAPVWVGLLSYLLFRKRAGSLFWKGTLLAVAGMVVLVGFRDVLAFKFSNGVLLALLSSVLYAVYILMTAGILQKTDTLTFMFYNMLGASVCMLVVCLLEHDQMSGYSTSGWLYLVAMGLLCQLTGWITINNALRHLESTKVSIALLSQTVFAGILAMILLGERLGLNEIIGSAIVLAGIALTFLRPGKNKPHTVAA
ncbi:DMT family transporter [Mucilaginibacter gotjawali]|uniref:Drug/metabolite transporter (DMT)-like permease n=1 Tax=Mucilaginibacter gotjawali TaxID=1550579 RepID=A0A839S8X2_9SPHI|nr:DMT family transporter [Mucilaginibacter gotjawali]MBB3054581.1 drug/metabolite transporter (DMT)-like permease [Mucilaginibacter gotjawali]